MKRKENVSSQESWKMEVDWVWCEDDIFCSICKDFPKLADKTSSLVKGIPGIQVQGNSSSSQIK